jgi:hypothetical protein
MRPILLLEEKHARAKNVSSGLSDVTQLVRG